MNFSYRNKNKRTVGYKRKRNYLEWTYSSHREVRVSSTSSRNRKSSSKIWGLILTTIKLGIELAALLIGSGKGRVRLLPELIFEVHGPIYNQYKQTL